MFKRLAPQVARTATAALLASAVLAASPARAQDTSRIVVTVTDATGGALPGVMVVVTRGTMSREAPAGVDGRAVFDALPAGDYEIVSTLSGFREDRRPIRVAAGASAAVSVALAIELLEQVVVTADRTGARNLQTTAMAVTALTGEDLSRAQARTVEDVAGRAPSVTFSQNTGFAQLTIRGIGTNVVFAGSDPSSAIYLDGVYLARPAMAMADFTGLERVEVLRGPQGTLYGRNAVGGAVNLITIDPTNALEATARVTAGSLGTFRAEARAAGAIVKDRVMGSVSFLRGTSRGFVADLNHPDHPLGGDDQTTARGKLRVVLNDRSEVLVAADGAYATPAPLIYARVLAVKPGFQVDNPPRLHDVRASQPATSRQVQAGGSARVNVHVPNGITLTSLTAYRTFDYDVLVDSDITELDLAVTRVHEIHHQWSEEATATKRGPVVTWVGGVYLFGDRDRQPTSVELRGLRFENRLEPVVESRATAAFAQATLALSPRVAATAGLRYTRERKTIANTGQTLVLGTAQVVSGFTYADAIAHDAWTPKLAIEARLGSAAMTYASATRGFKSGGFNASSPEAGRGYAPEYAWSYETGLKTTVAGGRLRLNAAVFYTSYTDLQVQTQIRPGVLDISNAAAATIRGFELETETNAGHSVRAGGHLAWLDATYDQYLAIGADGSSLVQAAGHRLSNAPEWSGRLWVEYALDLGRAGSLSLRADARRQSTVFFSPLNDAVQQQRAFGVVELSVRLTRPHSRWTLEAFARNLGNVDYITGTFSSPPPAIGGRPGDPRRIGVVLEIR